MTERMIGAFYDARWLLLVLLLPVLALAGLFAASVKTDNAVDVWFVDEDPALVAYDEFQRAFGNDEIVVYALIDDHPLDAAALAKVKAVTEAAEGTPGIAEVISIANVTHIRTDTSVELLPGEAAPLVVAPVLDDAPVDTIRERVLADPLLKGHLLSDDGNTAVVLVRMGSHSDIDRARDGILEDLDARVTAAAGGHVPSAGIGVVYSALNRASARDVLLLGAASYLLVLALLWWLLGRPGPVGLVLGIVGATAIVTLGVYSAMGHDLNMVTMAMPTMLFVMCIEDAVHMLTEIGASNIEDRRERIVKSVAAVFWPCLFTSLTAAAGFFSLITARMQVVRDLGWYSAFGILVAFVISVIVILPMLKWRAFEPIPPASAWLERLMVAIGEFSVRNRYAVILLCGVATLLGAFGMSKIRADTYSIDYFYEGAAIRQDNDAVEKSFGPYVPLEFVIESDRSLRTPEALAAIARWEDAALADPVVGYAQSPADTVRRLNQVLSDGSPAAFAVPADAMVLEQALLVYESDSDAAADDGVADGWKRIRVTVGVKMMSAGDIGATIDRLKALAAADPAWPADAEVVAAGYLPLYVTMMDYVVRSQVDSFGSAFLVVFGLLWLLFRSFRMTLLSVPGNLFPLFVTLGIMGLVGIKLDVATVTIASIVLGLVVNNTIHVLFRFREALHANGGDHEAAVTETMKTAGVAMATTSVALVLGFSILGFAALKSVAFFGMLTAIAMAAALVADVMLLPALLVVLKPRL